MKGEQRLADISNFNDILKSPSLDEYIHFKNEFLSFKSEILGEIHILKLAHEELKLTTTKSVLFLLNPYIVTKMHYV